MTDTTKGAVIHYTTNGTAPTAASMVYSKPISVSKSTAIRAIAVLDGSDRSPVAMANYTIGKSASASIGLAACAP